MSRLVPLAALLLWVAARGAAAPAAAEPAALVAIASCSAWTLWELERAGAQLASFDPETGVAHVVATPAEQARLQAAGFALATVELDVDAGRARIANSRDLGLYHTFDETEQELRELVRQFPSLCRLESLGQSLELRDIWALKISDSPADNDTSEPDVLVMGCHHAREFMSVEVPLHLARSLLTGAATNPRLLHLVQERETWIVPMVNPDGHVFQEELAAGPDWQSPGWRKNRRPNDDGSYGVDLNRNYGFRWAYDDDGSSPDPVNDNYRGTAPFSEPETQVVRALIERQRFVVALTYHSYGRLWLYPWGHTRQQLTPDQPVFAALADSMVRSNGYRAGNAYFGTIYLTNGECTDYLYGQIDALKPERTYAFTPELNSTSEGGFWPNETLIAPTCAAMLPANLFAIDVADRVRRPLPPPFPVLTATQDPADHRRIELVWQQPVDAQNPVSHWEVFEISFAAAVQSAPSRLESSGRAVLARAVPRPGSGRVVLWLDARLEPLWDYAYVEARNPGGDWVRLPGDATREASPTGRNAGAGLTGGLAGRRCSFDLGGVTGERLDIAVRLDAAPTAPQAPFVDARLDLGTTYDEERRVIAPDVREPHYTVVAERGGLFAYGVTAVDGDGQKQDSDIFFFAVPEVAVALQDVHVARAGGRARLVWRGDVHDATLEVWSRPLAPDAVVPAALAAWEAGGLERVASAHVDAARDGALEWDAAFGRELVVLRARDASGDRLIGAWAIEAALATRILGVAPNPFRAGGSIEFEIAHRGAVTLDVLAVDGRCVRALWRAPRDAGRVHVIWDGRDDGGRVLAAGVYFLRLRQAGTVVAARFVLLR